MKKQEIPTAKEIASKMMKEREKTTSMDSEEFMDSLKKLQEISGTPESQKVLDRLIAMQKAKKTPRALLDSEKRDIHTFMKEKINCDEYIVIALHETTSGLQTQLLTQLDSDLLGEILLEIAKEIKQQDTEPLTVSE
jgi:hypothetical protein